MIGVRARRHRGVLRAYRPEIGAGDRAGSRPADRLQRKLTMDKHPEIMERHFWACRSWRPRTARTWIDLIIYVHWLMIALFVGWLGYFFFA